MSEKEDRIVFDKVNEIPDNVPKGSTSLYYIAHTNSLSDTDKNRIREYIDRHYYSKNSILLEHLFPISSILIGTMCIIFFIGYIFIENMFNIVSMGVVYTSWFQMLINIVVVIIASLRIVRMYFIKKKKMFDTGDMSVQIFYKKEILKFDNYQIDIRSDYSIFITSFFIFLVTFSFFITTLTSNELIEARKTYKTRPINGK